MNIVSSLLLLLIGIIFCIFFYINIFIPISISVIVSTLLLINFFIKFKKNKIGLLVFILIVVYTLPFIHIIGYIWFDFESIPPERLWWWDTSPVVDDMFDQKIITFMAMLGVVGLTGISFGISLNNKYVLIDRDFNLAIKKNKIKTMNIYIWTFWVFFGLILSNITSPTETIFQSSHNTTKGIQASMNFASSWTMSYIVLIFSYADSLFERNPIKRIIKKIIILSIITYIFFWLQIMRGDREFITWIFAIILMNIYWARPYFKNQNKINYSLPWLKIMIFIFVLILIAIIISNTRHSVSGLNFSLFIEFILEKISNGILSFSSIITGTWTSILRTPLSVASDYINGELVLNYGKDYLNLFLSLPPGFVADFFEYVRPLSTISGPANKMIYGLGGTHSTVVPFMNFGIIGVFIIHALWANFFSSYEKKISKKFTVINLSFFGAITMVAPWWLWYGEKFIINTFIIWIIFSFFYKISIYLSRKSIY